MYVLFSFCIVHVGSGRNSGKSSTSCISCSSTSIGVDIILLVGVEKYSICALARLVGESGQKSILKELRLDAMILFVVSSFFVSTAQNK